LAPSGGQTVKILNFSKTKMAAAAILKITKIAISPQQSDAVYEIWHDYAKWVSYPPRPLKNLNFKMADGRYFKNR